MDRVSGWYKGFAQKWMIVIGLVLAAVFNVNTIRIVDVLSKSPNLAKAVASQAESYAHSNAAPLSSEEAARSRSESNARLEAAEKAVADAKQKKDATAIDAAQRNLAAAKENGTDVKFRAAVVRLSETGIPTGWDRVQLEALGFTDGHWTLCAMLRAPFDHFYAVVLLIGGWFITALAASLGAPFWFDMLNRIVNIRNAGKAPEEKDATGKAKDTNAPSLNTLPT